MSAMNFILKLVILYRIVSDHAFFSLKQMLYVNINICNSFNIFYLFFQNKCKYTYI